MEPTGKKPPEDKPPRPAPVRKVRFDPAHKTVPRPPHFLSGKGRPGDR